MPVMFCSCTWIFGKFASIYQTWIITQSSFKLPSPSPPSFISISYLRSWWMIFIWYPPQFKVTQIPQVANTPRAWHGSSHAESDELSQTVGQTLSGVVVGAESHLWDIATLSSLTAANMHLSEAISRMLESCFRRGKKSSNSCSGYFSRTCEFVPERALAQFIAFGAPDRSPHANLCQLILAQFESSLGVLGYINCVLAASINRCWI